MTLVRWTPFREMEAMQSEMNRLFSRFGGFSGFNPDQFGAEQNGPTEAKNGSNADNQWMLAVDVIETPDALKLKASLPGVDPQDVNIEINDHVLTISAQRRREESSEEGTYHWIEQQYGTFTRSLALPRYADTEKIEAGYNHGILSLKVPKRENSKPRRIALQTDAPEAARPRTLEAETHPQSEAKQLKTG